MVEKELVWVKENIGDKLVEEVQQFVVTAPVSEPDTPQRVNYNGLQQRMFQRSSPLPSTQMITALWFPNPQTEAYCSMLAIQNNVGGSKNRVPRP